MVLHPCSDYGSGVVDCYQMNGSEGGNGVGHHFYESIKSELESFRLQSTDGDFSATAAVMDVLLSDDTCSISSKKRIDSMFKTTASVAGDGKRTSDGDGHVANRRTKSLADENPYREIGNDFFDYGYAAAADEDNNNNNNNNNNMNTVQEKIEKMFAEISSSELDTDVSMDSAASNKYHVQYIGCAGLSGKISSLEGLQQPVRDMYFGYRENQHHSYGEDDDDAGAVWGNKRRDFSGLLEISAAGLTIRYRDETGDMVHRTDPFPSIAVWAALKYVCRRRSTPPQLPQRKTNPCGGDGYEYAFLPLIADPDGSDKAALFRDVDPGDRARLDAAGDHAPVFAVVTRKAGKRLECHGFACETENDALLMAANLYGALVTVMSAAVAADCAASAVADENPRLGTSAEPRIAPTTKRVIRQRNGFTSMSSTAGSSVGGGEVAPALPPPRPPRRNKKSGSSTTSSVTGRNGTSITADDGAGVCSGAKTFRMSVRQSPSLRRGVCNSNSTMQVDVAAGDCKKDGSKASKNHNTDAGGGGDILTKVAIPRSRSFLNSNGLASTKYLRRAAGFGIEVDADRCRRRSNSSVMGFSDMFNELRVQEGLNNMDDILNAIINVEGMSYNDLKPIYREFLMKLAMTLTKDELYQRTKVIMSEQKRKRKNKKGRPAVMPSTGTPGRGRRLNEKLRDALNLRAAKTRISATAWLPNFCKRKKRKSKKHRKHQLRCYCSANSSEVLHQVIVDRKPERKNQRRAPAGKRTSAPLALKGRRHTASSSPVCSTSDESEFFAAAALRQRQYQLQHQQLYRKSKTRASKNVCGGDGGGRGTATASEGGCVHRASSGYFSCSECSGAGVAEEKCFCGGDKNKRSGDKSNHSGDKSKRGHDKINRGGVIDEDVINTVGGGAEPPSLSSCSCDSDSCAESDKCYCGRPRNIFDELKSRGFAASESSVSRADSPGTAWKKNELIMLLQQQQQQQQQQNHQQRHQHDNGPGPGTIGGSKCGIESSKSLEYLQMARRPTPPQQEQPHYSSVTKPVVADRMKVYGESPVGSSSPSSSLSATTVYSSSSAVGVQHRRRQRRSGSSSSDNFQAIDYALFDTCHGGVGRKSRVVGSGRQMSSNNYYRADNRRFSNAADAGTTFSVNTRKSYSSEAVNLAGCQVYNHQYQEIKTKAAARRHSINDAGDDILSSFFKSDIANSLGYYP